MYRCRSRRSIIVSDILQIDTWVTKIDRKLDRFLLSEVRIEDTNNQFHCSRVYFSSSVIISQNPGIPIPLNSTYLGTHGPPRVRSPALTVFARHSVSYRTFECKLENCR